MPTALGRRSGAVYGEKSPKHAWLVFTVMVTLYILQIDVCVAHCIRRLLSTLLPPGSNLAGVCFFFITVLSHCSFYTLIN